MEVVRLYQPHTIFKRIILLDTENARRECYHLPILPRIQCLTEESRWTRDRSVLLEGVMDTKKVEDLSIFYLAEPQGSHAVVRLDILESMLKRGARGIGMTPLRTEKRENSI